MVENIIFNILGQYFVKVFYANGHDEESTHQIVVNNLETSEILYFPTGEWGSFGNSGEFKHFF